MPGNPAVEVDCVTKAFGNRNAVCGVSLNVARGEILGLAGPNGAGKSTLLHMLLGLITPDDGTIRIFGRRFPGDRQAILAKANIASPYASLPPRLTVQENLLVYALIYAVPRPRAKIASLLELMGMSAQRDTVVSRLSSGQQVRVNLCKALLNDPELLVLDEPTAYLDPAIAERVREAVIGRRQAGAAVIYASHNIAELESMCGRVAVMGRGRIAAIGTPQDVTRHILGQQHGAARLTEAVAAFARGNG